MGGKTSQSTQSVSIPPEVLARYNAVNTRAEQVAQRPFQQYTGQFVAPLTGTQQAGIQGTTFGANLAQPFFGAGAGMTMAGAQDVGALTPGQIAYYENPYIESVARPTYQALRQQQQEEMAGQTAQAIRAGAFGGDRAGLVAANLARQQQLGTAQAMAPIYAQGYGQAVQTAAGQQGVVAADLARRMQAGQQLAGLGAGAQQAALQGAQAQLAAGTAEQQTQQADLTARYNQFLQEQGYPFQVAQFLANIAMGTGALSGSTTTTTQPSSFFSDRRLKSNVEEIGKLKDGQKLYRYTMADGRTHIGLMADEVEKHHPDAVGVAGGYKTVDYRAATDDAARHKKAYGGGLMPSSEGGAVTPSMAGEGFARGGQIDEIRRLLTMHREMYPYGHSGLYGNPDPRKGPYSTTMREINVPSRPLAPTTITIRPLNYAADIPAGVPQYAAGGVVGYAAGGLPYSEASEEYVPEDISKPMTPQSLKPAGGISAQGVQDPTVRDLMQMGRMAASIYAGGGFASGGVVPHMADGGSMDFDRILAMQQGMYGQMGRPAGLNIPAMQPRDPAKSMELMKPARAPEPVKTGLQELQEAAGRGEQTYKMASGAYGAGKTALLGKAGTPAVPASGSTPAQPATPGSPGLIGSGGKYDPNAGIFADPSRLRELFPSFASGGVAGRRGYQTAGAVEDPYYDPAAIAAQDAIERENRDPAANRPFVSAPVSEAERASGMPAIRNDVLAPPVFPAGVSPPVDFDAQGRPIFAPENDRAIARTGMDDVPAPVPPPRPVFPAGVSPPIDFDAQGRPIFLPENLPSVPAPNAPPPAPPAPPVGGVVPRPPAPSSAPSSTAPAASATRGTTTQSGPQPTQERPSGATGVGGFPVAAERPGIEFPAMAESAGVAAAQTPASAQAQQPATMSGGEGGRGLLGAIASENFLVPLLTGLGAMASSPSRYLGSAILQGLGAGATAYENVQTKAAERDKIYADIVRNSYNPDMNAFMVFDENGRTIPIPNEEFQRNIRRGIRYNLAPYRNFAAQSAVSPATVPAAPQAPQQVSAPRIIPSGGPLWSGLTEEQYDRARTVAQRLLSNPRAMRPDAYTAEDRAVMSPYASIQASANVVNTITPDTLKFVATLADLGTENLTGSAVSAVRPLAEFYNSVVGAIGLPSFRIMPNQLGNMEAVDKAQTALSAQLARSGDQRSAQALQQLISANPGNLNSPDGRATIAAGMLIQNQRAKDLQNYANNFKDAVRAETGSDQLANLSGENLENEFSRSENARYQREAEAIKTMMRTPWPDGGTVMSYMINNAANLTKEDQEGFERKFGAGMMRYFR